ncbi:heterokaryon incompatibility protein-domain-containing protein [Xylaria curta]|nr:heterokaryon incompatibility protein-domain-containing protein [Xylaria curta]
MRDLATVAWRLSNLCSVCSQVQIPQRAHGPTSAHTPSPHHQTLESFVDAVRQNCYICVSIRDRLMKPNSEVESYLKASWTPMMFWILKDFAGRDLYKLNIAYPDPLSRGGQYDIVQFRLTPYVQENTCLILATEIWDSTSCVSAIRTALSWLQHCRHQHPRCGRYSAGAKTWRPSRLIDLGPQDSSHWKLIHTMFDPSSSGDPYIALSYRWGPSPRLLLLFSSMDEFQLGKPIEDLPKTFRDLTVIARKFRIQYIWIDALCILQDWEEDWNMQALTMRQVYAHAAFTVAASASADEDGGLFRRRDPSSVFPSIVKLLSCTSIPNTFRIFERDYWDRNVLAGPLHKRGWVFQERYLSPRVLYFTKTQIFWECFEEAKCEGFPKEIPFHFSDKNFSTLWDFAEANEMPSLNHPNNKIVMPIAVYSVWRDLVQKYSQCSLTKASDKFPAFAGIARLFQEITGDVYLAGLWKSRFLEGLDWRVTEPVSKASSEYRAPSWSWASVDGPFRPLIPGAIFEHLVELITVKIQPRGLDPTGCTGKLTLRGSLVRAIVESKQQDDYWEVIVHPRDKHGTRLQPFEIQVQFRLDYQGINIHHNQVLYFLPLNSTLKEVQFETATEVVFLILNPLADCGHLQLICFRIGHFVITEQKSLEHFGFQRREDELMVLSTTRECSTVLIK